MKKTLLFILSCCYIAGAYAQGLHFSQFYNAPLLVNPANAALMPEDDYRIGVNYRTQWTSVPVPYKTTSFYADLQLLRNKLSTNWIGLGIANFNDKAGDGNLVLNKTQFSLAYHIVLNDFNMLSFGASGGFVQRNMDFNRLSFDTQWDGYSFNPLNSNGEKNGIIKTDYFDLCAGINYAYMPADNSYLKIGLGLSHINRPVESFNNDNNQLGIRPNAQIEWVYQPTSRVILTPSLYFASQKSASELLAGFLTQTYLSGDNDTKSELILGCYYRLNESVIAVVGYQIAKLKFVVSYDVTMSALTPANRSMGAFELGLVYQGLYHAPNGNRSEYGCPRF